MTEVRGEFLRALPGVLEEALWRRDEELFAEVRWEEPVGVDARRYGIHPALLDAALHSPRRPRVAAPCCPSPGCGMILFVGGATAVRVRIRATGEDTVAVDLADRKGRPVLRIESLTTRPLREAGTAREPRTAPGGRVSRSPPDRTHPRRPVSPPCWSAPRSGCRRCGPTAGGRHAAARGVRPGWSRTTPWTCPVTTGA
ncbi:polyketide synthase dehydratase domain-containing protein [Streptomyces sp. NPDC021212]|uniref:polyketide synthase dehydratase domain-containing protein n=1 Tax=Streptomyces sp. NPDC021212 TaxID=3365118 RepID=UPI00379B26C3